jgi:hypothetical protein
LLEAITGQEVVAVIVPLNELAARWSVSAKTIRRLFANESGVLALAPAPRP